MNEEIRNEHIQYELLENKINNFKLKKMHKVYKP